MGARVAVWTRARSRRANSERQRRPRFRARRAPRSTPAAHCVSSKRKSPPREVRRAPPLPRMSRRRRQEAQRQMYAASSSSRAFCVVHEILRAKRDAPWPRRAFCVADDETFSSRGAPRRSPAARVSSPTKKSPARDARLHRAPGAHPAPWEEVHVGCVPFLPPALQRGRKHNPAAQRAKCAPSQSCRAYCTIGD